MLTAALRSLRRTPATSLVAIITLTLAIAGCTSVFAVVYGVLFAPLPYGDAASVVVIRATGSFGAVAGPASYSMTELSTWQQSRLFESVGGAGDTSFAMATDGALQSIEGAYVAGNFFGALAPRFSIGRPFGPAEDSSPVAVISTRLWHRRFDGRTDAIGRTITLDGHAYTVIGVAPPEFDFPKQRDVWIPAKAGAAAGNASWILYARGGGFEFVGRLAAGVPLETARAAIPPIAERLVLDGGPKNRTPVLIGLRDWVVGDARPALAMAAAAMAFLLAIACANVANLTLARESSRVREAAIRRALGARRIHIMTALLGETSLLALFATASALLLTTAVLRVIRSSAPAWLPRAATIGMALPVFVSATVICAAVVAICAVIPAWKTSTLDVSETLRAGGHLEHQTRRSRRVQAMLASLEIAATVVLLVGGVLLTRSFLDLAGVGIGADTHTTTAALLDLEEGRKLAPEERINLSARLSAGVRALPGVTAAAIGTSIPPDAARMRFTLRAAQTATGTEDLTLDAVAVTPGYFRTLGIGLESGRLFSGEDTAVAPPVMIVSEATARRIFGDRDPIGLSLSLPTPSGPRPVRVVGVVSNVKFDGLAKPSDGGIYRPFAQQPLSSVFVVASSTAPLESLSRVIASVDPQICILDSGPLHARVVQATSASRFRAIVIGGAALLGLALAVVGVFGVVSYSVVTRTAELGLRCAIGASPSNIIRLVLREAGAIAIGGAALGAGAAAVLARGLASLLFDVKPADPLSFAISVALVVVLTLVAAYVPARRASRVDVMRALRL